MTIDVHFQAGARIGNLFRLHRPWSQPKGLYRTHAPEQNHIKHIGGLIIHARQMDEGFIWKCVTGHQIRAGRTIDRCTLSLALFISPTAST